MSTEHSAPEGAEAVLSTEDMLDLQRARNRILGNVNRALVAENARLVEMNARLAQETFAPTGTKWQTTVALLTARVEELEEAIAFYAGKDRWEDFAADARDAAFDRNTGSEFGQDMGETARAAIKQD